MTNAALSPELVLVTPELRASACAALPPYPPYPPRPFTLEPHHDRAIQVIAYTLTAGARTALWGVSVAGTLAAVPVVAHLV